MKKMKNKETKLMCFIAIEYMWMRFLLSKNLNSHGGLIYSFIHFFIGSVLRSIRFNDLLN